MNLLIVGFGVLEGWNSPSSLLFNSAETPLASGQITSEEESWIASLLNVGALMGNIFFGIISNHFGRKLPLLAITIPMIVINEPFNLCTTIFELFQQLFKICWSLMLIGDNVKYFYAARFLGGFFGGGGYTLVPLYLSIYII